MKYENFDKVEQLVRIIRLEEKFLGELLDNKVVVKIHNQAWGTTIATIGPKEYYCDVNLSPYAETFLDSVKANVSNRIERLKKELEAL